MKIKNGVSILGLRPEMVIGILIAEGILGQYGQELVITSGIDGSHSRASLHYAGQAVDLRIRDLKSPQEATQELSEALGEGFDTVLESSHIHMEYQPKVGTNNG